MKINEIIDNGAIKISGPSPDAKAWIKKVYDLYPGTFRNNHVMLWGEGDNQQFAAFELVPSMTRKNAVEVKWFQAYPLRQGVGSRAMKELQRLARENHIALTLFPWQHGNVSQAKLMKFYKGQGFKPTVAGAKTMYWDPKVSEGREGEMPLLAATANKGEVRFRDIGGYDRIYHLHRIMMATAMADGKTKKAVDMDQASWVEKYNIAHPYTEEEHNMMHAAFATVDSDYEHTQTDHKSKEMEDTNKQSVVNKPKKNKYGV